MTIKDWIDVAGLPCTGGDPEFRDRIPSEDASVVSRLRSAGAIVLGKTNVMADNEVYGPTFNPHDLTRSPGGSSSGTQTSSPPGDPLSASARTRVEVSASRRTSVGWPRSNRPLGWSH